MIIQLSDNIKNEFIAHAEKEYPHECCGFILGKIEDGISVATEYIACGNKKEGNRERRFLIDPMDYQNTEDYADDKGLEIISIFHSHPDHPFEPSEFDRSHAWPGFSYIIISIMKGKNAGFRSWLLKEDRSSFDEGKIIEKKTL